MQPIVPECGLPNIVLSNRSQPFGVAVQIRDDAADIGRIKWHLNYRIRLIGLTSEFLGARRLADHPRPRRDTLVESRRNLITHRCELGLVDIAAIGYVVAA